MVRKIFTGQSFALAILLAVASSLNVQAQAKRNLVTQQVKDTQLVTLAGQIAPGVRPENDQGLVADSMPLEHVIMLLKRSPEQQQALTALIDQMHNPNSTAYHQWLTPEQFGEQFGPSDSDLATLTQWMESHGLAVEEVPPGRNVMIFSGTAGQIREAFHTELHHYLVNGEAHFANSSEPQIPAALGPLVSGFRSLNDIRLKSLKHDVGVAKHNMKTGEWEKVSGPLTVPDLTFTSGGSQYFFLGPQDFYTIYNENPLLSASPKIDGHGVTIAVIEETNVAHTSDVTNFRLQFGLPAYPVTPNSTDGGVNWMIGPGNGCSTVGVTSTGEEGEALLDVEWAGAVAPKAVVDFVACSGSNGIDMAAQYVTNYLASTVAAASLSYGGCEITDGSSAATFYQNQWEQAAAEGITAIVSSGDSGSLGCDQNASTGTHNLSVNELSDTAYNISAGGTDFSDFYQAHSYSTYWSTTNSTVPNGSSALSYIPEVTWGSLCANTLFVSYLQSIGSTRYGTTYTTEAICNNTQAGPTHDKLVAPIGGGGGVSTFNNLPTWQSVYGVGLTGNQTSTTMRNQPDISFFASSGWWGHALVYCQSDSGFSCDYSNTANDSNAYNLAAGGTSFVAPQMAGMMALIVQKTGARQGVANYTLYNLGTLEYGASATPNTSNLASCSGSGQAGTAVGPNCIFHDIAGDTPNPWQGGMLTSDNVQPCTWSSVQNCFRSSSHTYGLTTIGNHPATNSPAYPVSQGYDAATGLGSPNISNLVNNWNTVTPLFASTTALAADSTTVPTNGSVTLTATVMATGRGETLTSGPPAVGPVNFSLNSISPTLLGTAPLTQACTGTAPDSLVCPPSTAALVLPATALSTGTNSIIAYFPGDGANDDASTSSTITVTVQPVNGPAAGVFPLSLAFSNQNMGTISASQPVTLRNTGSSALAIASIIASTNFGQTNNCGGTLAASTSCTINVTFNPTTTGLLTGTLTVTDNSGGTAGSTQTVTLSGTGINPLGGVSPTTEAFGNQAINTTSSVKTVTFTSTGTTALSITSVSIIGTNAGDFHQTNACPATLAPAAHCTISVTYTPTILGAETASLAVADSASNSPQTVALTGTGVVPASLSPTTLAFGSVAENSASGAKTITLTNNGPAAMHVTSITTDNPDFAQTNNCGTSVAGKGHCTITVKLTPSVMGAESSTLTVVDAAANSPQTATLTGTGIAPATLSAASHAFGNVAENSPSSAFVIKLYNNEVVALPMTSISLSNPDYTQTNTCPVSVPAKGSCTINITLTPTVLGADNATLTVIDPASNSPQTATLTGTGVVPAYLSPTSHAFGNVGENSPSAAYVVKLYNNKAQALAVTSITFNNPDYTQTNTCGSSVAAKGSCSISIILTPTVLGADNATLTVVDAASNSPQTATLTGTGVLPATVSPTTLTYTTQTVGTTSAAKTVTLTSALAIAMPVSSISFTGANPGDFTQTNTCGTSLAAKGHCTISVTFKPTATGARSATLTVNDSASNTPQTVALTGTGN